MTTQLLIDHLGAQGDGVAKTETGPVYVRYALPGETITAARQKERAELIAVLEASSQRIEPACRHFGECGGCAIQHLEDSAYRAWKRDKVVLALRGFGLDAPVADLVPCAPASRRRAVFAARQTEHGILLGYHASMSHAIIPIEECPILLPAITSRLDELRHLVAVLSPGRDALRMAVTATEAGLDIEVDGLTKLSENARMAASRYVLETGFARMSVSGEVVVEPRKPVVMFGNAVVELPPGGFLQATADAETKIVALVMEHLTGAKKIIDLYSGSGAFALRLGTRAETHAVEAEGSALAALDRAFRFAEGMRRVTTERRDLDRRPVTTKELKVYDGLVFDPPRAGAELQVKQIAKAEIRKVAAVSCNPVTLARDLAILVEGGFTIKSVTPIDQFLWSPHVEAVALLEKKVRRK